MTNKPKQPDCTERVHRESEATALLLSLAQAERMAYDCGLLVAARAINRAANACGWEMAGNRDKAIEVAKRE